MESELHANRRYFWEQSRFFHRITKDFLYIHQNIKRLKVPSLSRNRDRIDIKHCCSNGDKTYQNIQDDVST